MFYVYPRMYRCNSNNDYQFGIFIKVLSCWERKKITSVNIGKKNNMTCT